MKRKRSKSDVSEETISQRPKRSMQTAGPNIMADSQHHGASLKHTLECPVCLVLYDPQERIPKFISCGHTFCIICLNQIIDNDKIQCPKCRRDTNTNGSDAGSLTTNYSMIDMLEVTCSECRKTEYAVKCNHCGKSLCVHCIDKHLVLFHEDILNEVDTNETAIADLKVLLNKEKEKQKVHQEQDAAGYNNIDKICNEFKQELIDNLDKVHQELINKEQKLMSLHLVWITTCETTLATATSTTTAMKEKMGTIYHDSLTNNDMATLQTECLTLRNNLNMLIESKPKTEMCSLDGTNTCFSLLSSKLTKLHSDLCVDDRQDGLGDPADIPAGPMNDLFQCASASKTFGRSGTGVGEFNLPWGACVCKITGDIFITDQNNHRIQVIDAELNHVKYIIGSHGAGDKEFDTPRGIAFDNNNKLYVADSDNHRIQILDRFGNFEKQFGSRGTGPCRFNQPSGLFLDEEDRLYICDRKNFRIQVCKSDGTFIKIIGCKAPVGQFILPPYGICGIYEGNIVMSERCGSLHVFTKMGDHVSVSNVNTSEFGTASGIAVNYQGHIFVSDLVNNKIAIFSKDGKTVLGNVMFEEHQKLVAPVGLACIGQGSLIVLDVVNDTVNLFTFEN